MPKGLQGGAGLYLAQRVSAEGGFARKPLASRYSTEPQQDTASIGEMKSKCTM